MNGPQDFPAWLDVLSRVMNVGMLLIDPGGRPQFANRLALDLLGCASEPELHVRWPELQQGLGVDRKTAIGRPPQRLTVDLPTRTGTRHLRLEIHARNEPECRGCLILLRDRHAADLLETDLLLASRMRSLVHVYRVLAHDLKAPLNAMQLTLELLADSSAYEAPDGEARRRRHIEVLREELSRLNRILQTMLDQKEPMDAVARLFDLREVIREIIVLLAPQARAQRVELMIDLPQAPTCIQGFRDRLKQALLNVAINGLEAMPGGGSLGIRLDASDADAVVRVSDTGPGISQEVQDEIDQIYFTTKGNGTGIGLYVARLVVESHGGEIAVESGSGKGTEFTVRLPLGNETTASANVAAGGYT